MSGLPPKEEPTNPVSGTRNEPGLNFQNILAGYSLASLVHQEAIKEKHVKTKIHKWESQMFANQKLNPFGIYGEGNNTFHALWTNAGRMQDRNIGWEETHKLVGKKEDVWKVLNVLAYCYDQVSQVYPWKAKMNGFQVARLGQNVSMMQPEDLGILVNYSQNIPLFIQAMKTADVELLRNLISHTTAEFIHERTHSEFGEIGHVMPEAISQGCQFLYAPGENRYFEDNLFKRAILESAEPILKGEPKRPTDWTYGNIVWATHVWEKLAKEYPEQFVSLTKSGMDNLAKLIQLPHLCRNLRSALGEEAWKNLRTDLMKSLLEYDPKSQLTIILDFEKKASDYGFEPIVKQYQSKESENT